MDDFLVRFFPTVYARKHRAKENNYCKFDDQRLQLFTSSLYLAALVTSLGASMVCTRFGRKRTMQAASVFFLIGAGLCAGPVNIVMLTSAASAWASASASATDPRASNVLACEG